MSNIIYIEDIFLKFHDLVDRGLIDIQYQDVSPIHSFYSKVVMNEQLTSNQGSYLFKMLEKYKNIAFLVGLDYKNSLADASWKLPFRILDLSKKIYVEKNNKGKLEVCCKFPYQLKVEFDKEMDEYISGNSKISYWDHENKVRRLSLYDVNLVNLYEFATRHSFVIDETFMCALADVEEIWQTEENIRPCSFVENNVVKLKNITETVQDFFKNDKVLNKQQYLMLAKSMGYYYSGPINSNIEKIASSTANTFWLKENKDFFELFHCIGGKIAIILDRSSNTLDWLKMFIKEADTCHVTRDLIKVCFRDSKESESGLNDWIKTEGVGGKVDSGEILIFEHKPAKWLFKEDIDVKIVVTNNLYPHTNQVTKDWLDSHPCVIYLGNIKPSEQRGKKIVEL